MIRVLQFSEFINRHDFIDVIVQNADRNKFEMAVCVGPGGSNIEEPEFGADVTRVVLPWDSKAGIPGAAWKLAGILKELEIDVLHAHHYDPAVIGFLATRIHRKTKFIFGRHYSDLVQNLTGIKRRFYLGLEQVINRGANRIIVPSTTIQEILVRKQGIDAAKIDVIPYGFSTEKYVQYSEQEKDNIRREFGMNGKFVVVSLGKLTKGKGVTYLAQAAVRLRERIPELLVVFVGEGEEREPLQKLIEKEGLQETIKIAGWRTDAMLFIACSDIVAQPTLSEAFSQVMGEAMSFGKPLIMTDVSGALDVIKDGENGLIVPKRDAEAMAASIEKLYQDPEFRGKVAEQGKIYVSEELSVSKIVRVYEASYKKAVG